nr:histone chaperone ASF1-like [Lolium perenne]
MDKNLQEELETRKLLLDRQVIQSSGIKAVNEVNETYAEDSARLEACDLDDDDDDDDDDDEHPDSFARKLGLGTQQIREINKKVQEEMGLEAEMKREEDDFNKDNADPDLSAMEEDDVAKLHNKAVVQLCDGDEKPETVENKKEKLGT